MSALAKVLLEQGYAVSGSDIKESLVVDKLRRIGSKVKIGHNELNMSEADVAVYSTSIASDNPELLMARRKNIPVLHRAELLAQLMNDKCGIAVTGTHGKTTTTTLISLLLRQLGFDPTVAIGAQVDDLDGGGKAGEGCFVVAEADESDGSFLFLRPHYSVITNIDLEHLDYYKNIEAIKEAYFQFMNRTKEEGKLFYCGDNEHLQNIIKNYERKMMSFGFCPENDIYALNISLHGLKSYFDVIYKGSLLGKIKLNIGGEHNILNCLAAVAVALELGAEFEKIKEALLLFQPALRRCQTKAKFKNIMVIDDYAHHPTEIKATLKALKNLKVGRIIAVFQPHRYSRTKFLKDLFVESFALADYLVMTDIYNAGERPIEGVDSRNIIDEIKTNGKKDAFFVPRNEVTNHLLELAKEGDLFVVLGAGDVGKVADELSEGLKIKFGI